MMVIAILFVVIALVLCAASLLALLGLGQLALSGADALERDGLARGMTAPAWSLADDAGVVRASPPARGMQLIVFADHCLASFPSVVAGLRGLRDERSGGPGEAAEPELEIVVLTRGRGRATQAGPALGRLGLDGIPVLAGSPARYAAYNVRVMPFAIFVDSAGRVRASSLVNHDWQLAKLSQVAAIPLQPDELAGAARSLSRRPARRLSRMAA